MHPEYTPTTDQKFDGVIVSLAAGQSLSRACTSAFTTLRFLTEWLSRHPNGKPLYATLLLAQADAAADQANAAYAEMMRRVDGGLIRNRGLADLELARIKSLTQTASQLRREAAQALPLAVQAPPMGVWQDTMLDRITRQYPQLARQT